MQTFLFYYLKMYFWMILKMKKEPETSFTDKEEF